MAIRIVADLNGAERLLEQLGRRANPAIVRALNKTATSVRASAARLLARETGVRVRSIRRRMPITRAVVARMEASIGTRGRDISLFSAARVRQTRTGISYRLRRGGTHRIPGAFILRPPGRTPFVAIRALDAGDVRVGGAATRRRRRGPGSRLRSRGPDLPVAKLVVPGIAATLQREAVRSAIEREASETLEKRMREELRFELLRITGEIPGPRARARARA